MKPSHYHPIWILLLATFICQGQGFGLVVNDAYYEDQPERRSTDGSKSTLAQLDSVQIFSLKDYCPTPRNQGSNASCVGWAVGYAAQTIYKTYREGIPDTTSIDEAAFSPYFIYNQIKLKDCALGAEIPDALRFIMTTGNVPNNAFTNGASDCFYSPNSQQLLNANQNRIPDYRKIFGPDDLRAEKINSTKLALLDGLPVIVAMNVTESFFKMESGKKIWYSELGSSNVLGAHALVVVGFNEIDNAFEVMNSWGTDWADNGFGLVRYKDFNKYVNYGFSFYEGPDDLISVMINFKRKSLITADQDVQYTEELFSFKNQVYEPVNTASRQNSGYRLDITHSSRDYSVTCFNKSGSGNYLLFTQLDQTIFDLYGSSSQYGISIPADKSAVIQLTDPVSEHFIFVVSRKPLDRELIRKISDTHEFAELQEVISSEKAIDEDCRYAYNKVGFISELKEGHVAILPVLFEYGTKP
jgi:hypothetical protein